MQLGKLIRIGLAAGGACLVIALGAGALLQHTLAAAQQAEPAPASARLTRFEPPPAVPANEAERLRDGLAAAQSGDWTSLSELRDRTNNDLVRHILTWRYAASEDAPLDYRQINAALRDLPGWPARDLMRARAERALLAAAAPSAERIAFLSSEGGPATGDGRVALALALRDAGRREEALDLARKAWREDKLADEAEASARAAFGSAFTQDDHAARVSMSLWREHRSAAERLMPQLSPADRLLADARIALQTRRRRGLQAAVDAVPASRRDDPGLLYDRAQYVRRTGRPERAIAIAADINAAAAPAITRDDIFREKRLYVPRALRMGDARLAYRLASNHAMTSGADFADAEWLCGWLSLRFLREPARAAEHFAHLNENVSAPISRSRALYWRAEAAKALGRTAEADAFLAEASRYDFTFYGQLAAVRRGAGQAVLSLPQSADISDEARMRFEHRELARALRVLSQVGAREDFEAVAFFLDDQLEDPQEIELLAQMAQDLAYQRTALRSAKAGLYRGVVAAEAAYPLLELPSSAARSGGPEAALVHAIIRQESEFDPHVISHAGARGLMQLMPSTARATARSQGIPYAHDLLTQDPNYNITLGAAYLGDVLDSFGGSYVLSIAAYNAGSHRAREWIADWGDPRDPNVDVVDWIELIPFSETRNYVQRVLENLQVYRHRINASPTPIGLEQDLRRGR